MPTKEISIANIKIGGANPLALIAGPCVIEGETEALEAAYELKEICEGRGIPLIYKSSYDKANRSSISSFRGPGMEKGLYILSQVKKKTGLAVLSDIHNLEEVAPAAQVLDVLQIPAFLSRQTDFILAAARTRVALNVKKGQFLAPWDVKNIIEKVESAGNHKILITERGSSFGYNNLVADMRSLPIMRSFGYPVVFDATHSVQLPGGLGTASGGQREFVEPLCRAAVAVGVDAIFLEVHPDPDKAPCDGPNMLPLKALPALLEQVMEIDRLINKSGKV
jgi:2-dehydro-3-deoxyphosphooctonate aldolase (KDO 8-P synthase)